VIAEGTLAALFENAQRRFKEQGFEEPEAEARGVLSVGLNVTSTEIYSLLHEPLGEDDRERCLEVLERRLKREPLAYIEGRKGFFGYEFSVNPSVLVPRPETELLVETAIREIKRFDSSPVKLADVGTGSGCIAISIARAIPTADVTAVDVSSDALNVARANAERLNLNGRIRFVQSDLFAALQGEKTGGFDIIVSNPPYVATSEFSQLTPDLFFEPRLALDGGDDGLRVIAPLIREARAMLAPGGVLLLEIGTAQGDQVRELLLKAGFSLIRVEKDYGGHDRIAKGVLSGSI
jgi:release factor glutamine methyltransferase